MFTKVYKKILIISIILLILVAVFSFSVYKYLVNNSLKAEIPVDQKINTGTNKIPERKSEVQLQNEGIKAQETNSGGTITVCLYKCGDGICQKEDISCEKNDLNCVCLENSQECPQDCPAH